VTYKLLGRTRNKNINKNLSAQTYIELNLIKKQKEFRTKN